MTGFLKKMFSGDTPAAAKDTSIIDPSVIDTSIKDRSIKGPTIRDIPAKEEKSEQPVPRLAFPEEIPEDIREAYEQACFLLQRCPKASGALSRYCLQQLARDFWELPASERGTLSAEFSLLSDRVLAETQESINYIRKFGSIESHLTKDRDLMVETTVDEAKMLIALVQLLVQEWYVDRKKRQSRCNTIKMMVDKAKGRQETESIKHCLTSPKKTKDSDPQIAIPPGGGKPIEDSLKDALAKMPPAGE